MGEGYEVLVVTDACGAVTTEAHNVAIRFLVQVGVVPINLLII